MISLTVQWLVVTDRIESDHMPVEMFCTHHMETKVNRNVKQTGENGETCLVCRESRTFCELYYPKNSEKKINEAVNLIEDGPEESLSVITDCLFNAASGMKKNIVQGGNSRYQNCKWFDKECFSKKKEVKVCLKRFRKSKDKEDYEQYAKQRKEYKSMLGKKKCAEKNASLTVLLDSMHYTKAPS